MAKRTLSIKPEVHYVLQRRHGRTGPRPQGIRTQNFAKIGPVVSEIYSRADTQTDADTYRWVDRNTLLLYHSGVVN